MIYVFLLYIDDNILEFPTELINGSMNEMVMYLILQTHAITCEIS